MHLASYVRLGVAILAISLCAPESGSEAEALPGQFKADTEALAHLVLKGDTTVVVETPIKSIVRCAEGLPTLPRRCLTGNAVEYVVPFSVASDTTGVDAVYQFIARYVAIEGDQADLADFVALPYDLGIIRWDSSKVEGGTIRVQTRYWKPGDGHAVPTGEGSVRIELGSSLRYALEKYR